MKGNSTTKQAWETSNQSDYMKTSRKGLDEDLVRQISADKNEPKWMLEHRLQSLKLFQEIPLPNWGPGLDKLNLDNITYYAKASDRQATNWDDVPADIKGTFTAF